MGYDSKDTEMQQLEAAVTGRASIDLCSGFTPRSYRCDVNLGIGKPLSKKKIKKNEQKERRKQK